MRGGGGGGFGRCLTELAGGEGSGLHPPPTAFGDLHSTAPTIGATRTVPGSGWPRRFVVRRGLRPLLRRKNHRLRSSRCHVGNRKRPPSPGEPKPASQVSGGDRPLLLTEDQAARLARIFEELAECPLERFRDAEADPVHQRLDASVCEVLGVTRLGFGRGHQGPPGALPGAFGYRETGAMRLLSTAAVRKAGEGVLVPKGRGGHRLCPYCAAAALQTAAV